MPSERFSEPTRSWLAHAFAAPTAAQSGAWEAIGKGEHTLVVAPTGSGKTLAAFLSAIDRLTQSPEPTDPQLRCSVVYVSPLKALASDIERNLRSPLVGIEQEYARAGRPWRPITVGVRTGDTPQAERARMTRTPPDILITTPESLYLMLTSHAREIFRGVTTVIVDEVHALVGGKRGAHAAVSLARLDALAQQRVQRIGLSATVRPLSTVTTWLSPTEPVSVVNPESTKQWDLSVVVPVADMTSLAAPAADEFSTKAPVASMWPHVEQHVAELVGAQRSTIVFANSRRLAERLTANLNDLMVDEDAAPTALPTRAHHGSVSKEQRADIEEALKTGQLKAVVATSSLELGIDMGAVDLVVQVESPPSVASGLQRVGRAGHQVGAVSKGVLFPKFRGDLVASAVVVERMRAGLIEHLRMPSNPLDVLGQQIVAVVAMQDISADDVYALMRRAAPFADLPRSAFDAVLDLLSGRYAHDEFAELRPRLVWDRDSGILSARSGTQRLAVTNGGTIPDRGLFPVLMVGERNTRVGELDEEMVYESREGDVFALGTSTWRIEDITHDAVYVSPAPGQAGKLPFWKGDMLGRPLELGRAIGEFVREVSASEPAAARERLAAAGLDAFAQDNLISYVEEQRSATGMVPCDKQIVVERARDELGDWRVIVHSPFGAAVHAPWALIVTARFTQAFGFDPQVSHADDGIVLRIPDYQDSFDPAELLQCLLIDPDDVESELTALVGGSALFASRFRECAARSLLLPKRDPRRRAPLWQQRQRAAQLLSIASKYSTFPILLETMREVMQDVYDVAGLRWLMQSLRDGHIAIAEVATEAASPFARSLLFDYIAQYLYEGDNPLAERRAAALTLDAELLTELLGTPDLRDLLDPAVVALAHEDLQCRSPQRRAGNIDAAADLFRTLGPLTREAAGERGATAQWLDALVESRRLIEVRIAGVDHLAAIEDAGRLRDALGVALPVGIPHAYTDVVPAPLHDLLARWGRTRGPFTAAQAAAAFGLGVAAVELVADALVNSRRWHRGQFTAEHADAQYCDTDVLRLLRRRAVAALRKQAEPVEQRAYARFLPGWHAVGRGRRGMAALVQAIEQLQGYPIAVSTLESSVLPARVADYQPGWLDELIMSGELVWVGRGALPGEDGWISLHPAGAPRLPHSDGTDVPQGPAHTALTEVLRGRGAWLFRDLAAAIADFGMRVTERDLGAALWDLVWAGQVSTDSLTPVRALLHGRRRTGATTSPRPRLSAVRVASGVTPLPLRLAGRWHFCGGAVDDGTAARTRAAEQMLARHGVLTGPAVNSERLAGGWSGMFPVLSALEERGRTRRGYIVEGLGGAQFSTASTMDVLREYADGGRGGVDGAGGTGAAAGTGLPIGAADGRGTGEGFAGAAVLPHARTTSAGAGRAPGGGLPAVVLAATDPANPFGAALTWPPHPGSAHRPGRKVGAHVVIVDGVLVLFVERGGKTLLCFDTSGELLDPALTALIAAVRERRLPMLSVETIDGVDVCGPVDCATQPGLVAMALESQGALRSPRGLVVR